MLLWRVSSPPATAVVAKMAGFEMMKQLGREGFLLLSVYLSSGWAHVEGLQRVDGRVGRDGETLSEY